jgi:DNA-binding CsgD family transcriptional regulator/PAS domain-containing protein
MSKGTREALEKVRAVEDSLAHFSLDGDNVQAAVEALHDLLGTEKLCLHGLGQRSDNDDVVITREAGVGYPRATWREIFDDFARGRGLDVSGFNVLRPEPAQRDRVLGRDQIAALTQGRSVAVEELDRRLGTHGHDTTRVLVCDGPSTLAWLGFIQPDKATEHQRELLERIVPAFRRRLLFDRMVAEATLANSAMVSALEHLPGAAWVLDSDGRIAHANVAGRARFDDNGAATRAALGACAVGTADPRFKVMPLRGGDGRVGHIVVEVPDRAATSGVGEAARRFGLTPAQTRVIERVARGVSNATIAAELGVAERTVEAHVTAILVKAQVPSRAALIVQIFRDRASA